MRCSICLLLILPFFGAAAQHTGEDSAVVEVVSRVFTAMELGDSAMLRTAFVANPTTATIVRDKNNRPVLRQDHSIRQFLNAVGTPHKDVWYEEIWNVKVERDGDLAQVWCDYAFYAGNTFIHCGSDAFHLHRSDEGWKIFHLSDTRRTSGCEIPQEIQDKHK